MSQKTQTALNKMVNQALNPERNEKSPKFFTDVLSSRTCL